MHGIVDVETSREMDQEDEIEEVVFANLVQSLGHVVLPASLDSLEAQL